MTMEPSNSSVASCVPLLLHRLPLTTSGESMHAAFQLFRFLNVSKQYDCADIG